MTLVLLTAAVTPSVGGVTVSNADERLRQYQEALMAWSTQADAADFDLAIVETTGAEPRHLFKQLPEGLRKRITFVPFEPAEADIHRGKGAIERSAVHAALRAVSPREDEAVYKCTGRLVVSNAARVIQHLEPASVRVRMTIDRSWADSRLFGASADVWFEHLMRSTVEVSDPDGVEYERVLAADIAFGLAARSFTLSRFPERPLFDGVSGTTGQRYSPTLSRSRAAVLHWFEISLSGLAARKQA